MNDTHPEVKHRTNRYQADSNQNNGVETMRINSREYLEALSARAPPSTVRSHRSTLSSFVDYCQTSGFPHIELDYIHVSEFIVRELSAEKPSTITGKIGTLSNFLAYYWEDDPEIVRVKISKSLCRIRDVAMCDDLTDFLSDIRSQSSLDQSLKRSTNITLAYLQNSRYGTLTHAYLDILTATRGHPSVVRKVNMSDLDLESGTIELEITSNHAVGIYDLIHSRTIELPENTIETLCTYCDYERINTQELSQQPLFTTSRGRVSSATMRRKVRKSSQSASARVTDLLKFDDTLSVSAENNTPLQVLTPEDIWIYSLATIPSQQ